MEMSFHVSILRLGLSYENYVSLFILIISPHLKKHKKNTKKDQ